MAPIPMLTPQQIARALGGDVCGNQVLVPGPGHSPKDRSLSIRLIESAPNGFLLYSFAGDDPIVCKDYLSEKLGLQPPNGRVNGALRSQPGRHDSKRTETAVAIWKATT